MMKMNKYIAAAFFLLAGIIMVYPQNAEARECTMEEINNNSEKLKDYAKEALKIFDAAAKSFNDAAKDYISSCNTPQEKKKYKPDDIVAAAASNLGYDYGKPQYWEYTGYNWDQEVAPNDESKKDCVTKLAKVTAAKNNFNAANKNANGMVEGTLNPKNIICTCDDAGSMQICTYENSSTESQGDEVTRNGCKQFQEYQQELSVCPLCSLFEVILQTVADISSIAWHAVAKPLSNVVGVIFLVLLALEVLKAVGAAAGAKISSLAKGVLVLGGKVAITIMLLSSPKYIYGYFLSPVIEGGLNMGINIATSSGPGANCAMEDTYYTRISSDTFDTSLYSSVLTTVRCFGVAAATLPGVGRGLICNGWQGININFSVWLSGIILYVFGLMIWLAISFYMLDCTVQIGMFSALVPLLVACWPFKMTETYTFKGCKMLMNTFFTYAMLGIVLLIGIEIATFSATADGSNINDIITAINENDIKALKKMCSLDALQMLVMGACCIFALKLVGQSTSLADQFSKGSGSSIGNKMGGMASDIATKAAVGSAKGAARVAGGVAKYASDKSGLTAAVNKGKDKVASGYKKTMAGAGKMVGLGKYQNKQTGSGKEDANGKNNGNDDKSKNKQNDNQSNENKGNDNQNNKSNENRGQE